MFELPDNGTAGEVANTKAGKGGGRPERHF